MRNLRQFWTARRIGDDRVTLARLGPLRLWLARADKEWAYAVEYGESNDLLDIAQVPEDVVPEDLAWTSAIFKTAPREFMLQPSVPDRAVVVKPNNPIVIPPSQEARFHVLLPVFIRVVLILEKEEMQLCTLSSRKLSDTWFGTPTEGEFCYSLPRSAELERDILDPRPHHILCPLVIENRSTETLTFQKLCFRPQYIGIYCGDRYLRSSEIVIQHEGHFKGVSVSYAAAPPKGETDLLRLAEPMKREERGLSRLTFSSGFRHDVIFKR